MYGGHSCCCHHVILVPVRAPWQLHGSEGGNSGSDSSAKVYQTTNHPTCSSSSSTRQLIFAFNPSPPFNNTHTPIIQECPSTRSWPSLSSPRVGRELFAKDYTHHIRELRHLEPQEQVCTRTDPQSSYNCSTLNHYA